MRELMLTGFDWSEIGLAFLLIAALALVGLPLTVRNYRSVYGWSAVEGRRGPVNLRRLLRQGLTGGSARG